MHPVLFFDSAQLLAQHVGSDNTALTFLVQAVAPTAWCPLCGRASQRVHSRYLRQLTDLPCHGKPVQIRLLVRRFFCLVPECPRRIFAERLPAVTAVQARTTLRLRDTHCAISFALGGEAGARLAARLAMPTSPDTLLRRVRSAPLPPSPPVRILGVDDWAFRKGHHTGTILCDLERRRPVELLPERSAEALAAWLKEHPQIEIISRDRADDYIRGATAGAPQAVQAADRWHLLRNLRDALMDVVDRHHADVRAAAQDVMASQSAPASTTTTNEPTPASSPSPPALTARTERQHNRRCRRHQRYEEVVDLHRQGLSHRAIAERLHIHRSTVRHFVEAGSFPDRAPRDYARRTDRFAEYLKQRWVEGCRNATKLFDELKAQGFSGSYYAVRRQLAVVPGLSAR